MASGGVVMAKVLDCDIIVCGFELQLRYYIHFQINTPGKDKNSLISTAVGKIVPLLSLYMDDFGIR